MVQSTAGGFEEIAQKFLKHKSGREVALCFFWSIVLLYPIV